MEQNQPTGQVPEQPKLEAPKPVSKIEDMISRLEQQSIIDERNAADQNRAQRVDEAENVIVEKENQNEQLTQKKTELLEQYKIINELHGNLRTTIHKFNESFATLKESKKDFFEKNNINTVDDYISFFGSTEEIQSYQRSKREIVERVSGIKKEDGKVVEVGEGEVDKTRVVKTELAEQIGVDPKLDRDGLMRRVDNTTYNNTKDIKEKSEEIKVLDGERVMQRLEEAFDTDPQAMDKILASLKKDIELNMDGNYSGRTTPGEIFEKVKLRELLLTIENSLSNHNLSAEDFSKYGEKFVKDILKNFVFSKIPIIQSKLAEFDPRVLTDKRIKENYAGILSELGPRADNNDDYRYEPFTRKLYESTPEYIEAAKNNSVIIKEREEINNLFNNLIEPKDTSLFDRDLKSAVKNDDETLRIDMTTADKNRTDVAGRRDEARRSIQQKIEEAQKKLSAHGSEPLLFGKEKWKEEQVRLMKKLEEQNESMKESENIFDGMEEGYDSDEKALTDYVSRYNEIVGILKSRGLLPEHVSKGLYLFRMNTNDEALKKIKLDQKDEQTLQFADKIFKPRQ